MGEIANNGKSAHGARRIENHPVLGALPSVPIATFTLDDRTLTGRLGEPILAALLANGRRVCRAMPHSGEARGGYCLVGRCADCFMVVDGEPNVRTCQAPLRDGLRIATQRGLGTSPDTRSATGAAKPEGASA